MMSFRAVMGETLPLPQQFDNSNESQIVVFLSCVYFIHRGENEGTLAWILQYIQIAARKCLEHLIPDSQAVLHIHLIETCSYIPNEQFSLISKKLSL